MENDLDSILTPILMVNWVKIWVFEPKKLPYIGLSPLLKIILEKSCLVQNVVCGCIILSNGSMLYSEFIFVVTLHDQMVQIVKLCA